MARRPPLPLSRIACARARRRARARPRTRGGARPPTSLNRPSDERGRYTTSDDLTARTGGRVGVGDVTLVVLEHGGQAAFGINAWSAAGPEDVLIREHEDSSIAHEELYVVVDGHATFTVDGQEIDAPARTIVFVRDSVVQRSGRAKDRGATILTVGAKPGEAFRSSPWEVNAEIIPLFERGELAEVKRRLKPLVAANPQAAGSLYNSRAPRPYWARRMRRSSAWRARRRSATVRRGVRTTTSPRSATTRASLRSAAPRRKRAPGRADARAAARRRTSSLRLLRSRTRSCHRTHGRSPSTARGQDR